MKARRASCRPRGRAAGVLVFGVVQGVGFRPFVYRLARELGIRGWVQNVGRGVALHLEAEKKDRLDDFFAGLRERRPPLARIESLSMSRAAFRGLRDFRILKSRGEKGFVFISPDIATCPECLEEIRNPGERRFGYPFTNCTNCGPRYTIVRSLPYDRAKTSMAGFPLCPDCLREYLNPRDRRYHAQPIACPVCGPEVRLVAARTGETLPGGVPEAARLLEKGSILAVKGIGGFHLVCDALRKGAVRKLRTIKARKRKPLALMAADIQTAETWARLGKADKELLLSPNRPIVLAEKRIDLPGIAPGLNEVGIMLPYAPLHHLLLERTPLVVATSSNAKDAPIMKDEEEGLRHLCDFILTHNRPIVMRADDSVVKTAGERPLVVRRARGYVPHPQPVPRALRSDRTILALGGELKDTVSLYKDGYVVTSQFLGDLDDYRNFGYFQETLAHLTHLFGARPDLVVSDLHPDFRTTRFAERMGLPHLRVQHHFAHVLAPLLEHGVVPRRKILGVALDGYGYGDDGTAWGGEFLLADFRSYRRFASFQDVPLPGGDLAARQPWRMAAAYLHQAFGRNVPTVEAMGRVGRKKIAGLLEIVEKGFGSPRTSSCGRLFDAVSFLCGLAPMEIEYEAEAAMLLEASADLRTRGSYPFALLGSAPPFRISFLPLIQAVVADLEDGMPPGVVSARFHNSLAKAILCTAQEARRRFGTDTVVLAGGVFLNKRLLISTERILEENGFRSLRSLLYSPGDESLSLGQIGYALASVKRTRP